MSSPKTSFLASGSRTVNSRNAWALILFLFPVLAFSHGDTPFSTADVIHACRSPFAGVLRKIDTGNCQPTEAVVHWNTVGPQGVAGPPGTAGVPGDLTPTPWDHMTTAAAMGYCLAKHPYQTLIPGVDATPDHPRGFTPDGYEMVPHWGVVGAVRRNFIRTRSTTEKDEGTSNSCTKACRQFGIVPNAINERYNIDNIGVPLHQKIDATTIRTSGIGDMAAMAMPDRDFYLGRDVIAGITSVANGWFESDDGGGGQADFCCCAVKALR